MVNNGGETGSDTASRGSDIASRGSDNASRVSDTALVLCIIFSYGFNTEMNYGDREEFPDPEYGRQNFSEYVG